MENPELSGPMIERQIRKFLVDSPGAFDIAYNLQRLKNSCPLGPWPDWCFLPTEICLGGIINRLAELQGETRMHFEEGPDGELYTSMLLGGLPDRDNSFAPLIQFELHSRAAQMALYSAWRLTKGIYQFDPDVFAAVWETPITEHVPSELLLRLPEWAVYVETPSAPDIYGFFATLDVVNMQGRSTAGTVFEGVKANTPCLRLLFCAPIQNQDGVERPMRNAPVKFVPFNLWLHASVQESIFFTHYMLDEKRRQRRASIQHNNLDRPPPPPGDPAYLPFKGARQMFEMAEAEDAEQRHLANQVPNCVSLLLYLCSLSAEIRDDSGNSPRLPKPKRTRRKGRKYMAKASSKRWLVAQRLGAALRLAKDAKRNDSAEGMRSPRPHFRRAHWHTYWTGKGRTVPVLKWLHPIAVKMENPDDLVPASKHVD
jgi:hypothetical protein